MRAVHAAMTIGLAVASVIAAMESAVLAQVSAPDTRPVTLVVAIAAGGGVDTIARVFAQILGERLKQPWVVENRPGAGGLVGLDSVAKATPDGHTLATFETSAVLQQWLHRNVPFDAVADFAPVAQMATTPLVLFAGPSSPVADIKGLIAYAKANPGKLAVGTPGIGTPHSLAAMMLNAVAGIDVTQVTYKGTAPALNDLLGGQIPLIWATPNVVMQYVETGKVKALAVGSPERIALLPNVPTVSESGVPGFDVSVWFGIAAPAKSPADIIARDSAAIAAIDKMPELRTKLAPLGYELDYLDSAQFAQKIAADHVRYGKVIRDAGIKPD
jgi:tripartite-type tricarboxylate transporter receptor subunit TctC